MLVDTYYRLHDYLRISLTDKCNLRCTYCNPVNLSRGYFSCSTQMTAEEIDKIVSVFVNEGIKKIRLTGGEPLVRKDAREIIERLSKYPIELAITTNGVFVHKFIDLFKRVGIRSVNVSLDSLDKENNFKITLRDEFEQVKRNIDLLLENNFHVKVNVVVMKNVNDDEILNFVEWTKHQYIHVRFIEFMPFADNKWSNTKVFSYREIMDLIATKYDFIKLQNEKNDTAKSYIVSGYKGTFAVISTMSEPFCSGCNRLRLTTDGKMKNCLFSTSEIDILGALRKGEDILPLIKVCVANKYKALGGQFTDIMENTDASRIFNRRMIDIGG